MEISIDGQPLILQTLSFQFISVILLKNVSEKLNVSDNVKVRIKLESALQA